MNTYKLVNEVDRHDLVVTVYKRRKGLLGWCWERVDSFPVSRREALIQHLSTPEVQIPPVQDGITHPDTI